MPWAGIAIAEGGISNFRTCEMIKAVRGPRRAGGATCEFEVGDVESRKRDRQRLPANDVTCAT